MKPKQPIEKRRVRIHRISKGLPVSMQQEARVEEYKEVTVRTSVVESAGTKPNGTSRLKD